MKSLLLHLHFFYSVSDRFVESACVGGRGDSAHRGLSRETSRPWQR